MLRAAAVAGLRQRGFGQSRPLLRFMTPHSRRVPIVPIGRAFSSEGRKQEPKKGGTDEEMTQEIVLTPGEKVVAGTRLTMWAAAAAFASVCAYYIARELIPT